MNAGFQRPSEHGSIDIFLMKNPLLRTLALGSVSLSLLLSSCVVDPYACAPGYGRPMGYRPGFQPAPAEGSVAGALLGAAAGGIIGNQSGRGLEGAALGGVLGMLAGGALQNGRQQRYGQSCYHQAPACSQQGYYAPTTYQPPYQGYDDPYAFDGWR